MLQCSSKMSAEGGILIPFQMQEALKVRVGDDVLLRLEDGELRIISQAEAIRRAQSLVAQYIPETVSLVDELLAERREAAVRE
jgi:antitoxin component of MazEF toxin-antitoxin module